MRRENSTKTKWQTRSLPATFNATQTDGQRRIEGYFATFSGVYDMGDGFTEQIDPHAFDDQLGGDVRALCLTNHNVLRLEQRKGAGGGLGVSSKGGARNEQRGGNGGESEILADHGLFLTVW